MSIHRSGIYLIKNKVNNNLYVGSSKKSIRERFWSHRTFLRMNKHGNPHLQNAWNKYGEVSFEFIELEYCESNECIEREQYYIDALLSEYNICVIAANSRFGCKQISTPESEHNRLVGLRKYFQNNKEALKERGKKQGIKNKGRVHKEENKEKFRNAARKNPVIAINLEIGEQFFCKSISEAKRLTGVTKTGIIYSCKNPQATTKYVKNRKIKWKFKYDTSTTISN